MSHAIAADQREHRRLQLAPTIIRADIEQDGKSREGYLINVSLGGAFLSIADPPAKDTTTTDLHMLLPWGIGECHVQARTVWEQTDDQERAIGAGISFIDLSEDASNQLQSYLDRFKELSIEITS
ncbi:MAG: PilZ domain-containing protein [Acidobacteria bacterium]|nr:MAG: PilZ domain-containing protein [Acidobacteriota bacterium]